MELGIPINGRAGWQTRRDESSVPRLLDEATGSCRMLHACAMKIRLTAYHVVKNSHDIFNNNQLVHSESSRTTRPAMAELTQSARLPNVTRVLSRLGA